MMILCSETYGNVKIGSLTKKKFFMVQKGYVELLNNAAV